MFNLRISFAILAGLCSTTPAVAEQRPERQQATAIVRELPRRIYGSARAREPLTSHEALKRIKAGQAVYVGLSTGRLRRGSMPRFGKVWIDRNATVSKHEGEILDRFLVRQRVKVAGVEQLLRLNAADRLTSVDTNGALSEIEGKVARVLRTRAGGIHGSARIAWVFDDFHRPAYKVRVRGPRLWEKNEGLFDPGRKVGGFLGLFRRPARLSVLEATDRIVNKQQAVRIRDRSGVGNSVANVEQLVDLFQLSR